VATYGNGGNRWWVGLNVAENGGLAGTPTLTLDPSPSGYESLPSGNAADDAQFAAAARKDKGNSKPVTISVEHVSWFNIQGPYTTQAAANAAIPAIQKASPAPGLAKQLETAIPGASAVASVEDFLSLLTSGDLWIRVVKVLAGGIILAIGLAHLTGADKKLGGIASKAVTLAPFLL
jgi:hypothetical protein